MTTNPRTIDPGSVKARLAELHLRDYLEFVVWPILEPATPFVGGWPIDAMCEHLEAVTDEEIRHLLITIPPRHTKSTTVSVRIGRRETNTPPPNLLKNVDFCCLPTAGRT